MRCRPVATASRLAGSPVRACAFTYVGTDDFDPVPRICHIIMAINEEDLSKPKFAPPSRGYADLDPAGVIRRATYADVGTDCPPYIVYLDRTCNEVLMDSKLSLQMFDGGYVHYGLLKAAQFILEKETKTLRELLRPQGPGCRLVFAGDSLGFGITALMTMPVVNNRRAFGDIPRSHVRCYVLAPARCMSLNVAVKYADVIYSIVLQLLWN